MKLAAIVLLLGTLAECSDFDPWLQSVFANIQLEDEAKVRSVLFVAANASDSGLVQATRAPVIVYNYEMDPAKLPILKYGINSNVMSVLSTTLCAKSAGIAALAGLLQFIRFSRVLVVLKGNASTAELGEFFRECWGWKFLNVLVANSGRLWSYSMFPELCMYEVDRFEDKMRDLQGFGVQVGVVDGPPRSLIYTGVRNETRYGGYYVHSILTFLQRLNASFVSVQDDLVAKMYSDELHFYTSIVPIFGPEQNKSDTFEFYDMMITVPVAKEIPRFAYLFRPLDAAIWGLICATLLYVSCSLDLIEILYRKQSNFSLVLLDCFRAILYFPFGSGIRQKRWVERTVVVLILVFAFIMTSYYSSILGSFLTTAIHHKELNHVADLARSDLRILCIQSEYDILVRERLIAPQFQKFFIPTDIDTLLTHRNQLNTTFGYIMPQDKWDFYYQQLQRLHNKYTFRAMTYGRLVKVHLSFPMHADSIFKESFNIHVHQMRDTGVFEKWRRDAVYEMIDADLMDLLVDPEERQRLKPLCVEYFYYAWAVLVGGLSLSLVVFGGELFVRGRF